MIPPQGCVQWGEPTSVCGDRAQGGDRGPLFVDHKLHLGLTPFGEVRSKGR